MEVISENTEARRKQRGHLKAIKRLPIGKQTPKSFDELA
jgi:hypothetical protein